jgi:hypothetical protein
VLKVRAQFLAILLLDPERSQDGRDGTENHGIDIVAMDPVLFCQRLDDNGPNILVPHDVHGSIISRGQRLMILATFSNPRFAK